MILIPDEQYQKLYDVHAGLGLIEIASAERDYESAYRLARDAFTEVAEVISAVDNPEHN